MKGLAAAALVFIAAPLSARTLRVAKDGSADVKTLDKALEQAEKGDYIVLVGQGVLGLGIQKNDSKFDVTYIRPGSAAEKAGIEVGSRLVLVEDKDISSFPLPDVIDLLRGAEGSQVKVHIQPAGSDEAKAIVLTRGPRDYTVDDELSKANIASAENRGDLTVKYAEKAADKGSVAAMEKLAWVYYAGWPGIDKNDKLAARWARKAADAGSHQGEQTLGALYLEGRGVPKDLGKFYEYSRKAALGGVPWGERNLGIAYAYGYGVKADDAGAEAWLKRAADHGVEQAQKDLDAWRALKAGQKAATAKPAPEGAAGLTRVDIQQMMREALKEQQREQKTQKPAAANGRSSDVDAPGYAAKKERPDDLAVVIGIEKYASLPEASYAERDARAVRAHLVALGYPERNIFALDGAAATKSAFIKELEARLKRLAKPDSTIFVYYSGHGAPDPKTGAAYLVPYDGDPEFLDETAYPVKRLYAKLAALPAKRVIVALDSCFSGAGGRSVLAKGARPLVSVKETAVPAGKIAALTAASGGEISGALDEQGHGLFTYYFLKGLNDGKTTLGGLHGYLKAKVADEARRHNRDQTPELFGDGAAELGK